MRILITGGAGFIGSHVAERLRFRAYHEVMVIDNCSTGRVENLDHAIPLVVGDIRDYGVLSDVFFDFRPEMVVHLAAQPAISTSWRNYQQDADINIMGTLNLIRMCKETGVRRIVFSSTSAVYDENEKTMKECGRLFPASPYGISKLAAERYIATLLPESVVLRFGNVYGPRQIPLGENQVIPRMILHFEKGNEFFIFGDGEQRRDFVFVEDVAAAVDKALIGKAGIYNIASGMSVSINELATMMATGYDLPIYPWQHSGPNDTRRDSKMRIGEAAHGLDWVPETSLSLGLQLTIEWWKQRK